MATPIIESITQNVITTLQTVTTANGYDNTLTVEQWKKDGNRIIDGKTVVILDDSTATPKNPYEHITWQQGFFLFAYVIANEQVTSVDTALNSIASDIEKALMIDPHRNNLAIDTLIDGHDIILSDTDVAICVKITVVYRTLLTNPYSL